MPAGCIAYQRGVSGLGDPWLPLRFSGPGSPVGVVEILLPGEGEPICRLRAFNDQVRAPDSRLPVGQKTEGTSLVRPLSSPHHPGIFLEWDSKGLRRS
jgi:hypothetical protein